MACRPHSSVVSDLTGVCTRPRDRWDVEVSFIKLLPAVRRQSGATVALLSTRQQTARRCKALAEAPRILRKYRFQRWFICRDKAALFISLQVSVSGMGSLIEGHCPRSRCRAWPAGQGNHASVTATCTALHWAAVDVSLRVCLVAAVRLMSSMHVI